MKCQVHRLDPGVNAGGNITIESTVSQNGNRSTLDRQAVVYVGKPGGTLQMPTMLPAAAVAIPAALNDPSISWLMHINTNAPPWQQRVTSSGTPSVVGMPAPLITDTKGEFP